MELEIFVRFRNELRREDDLDTAIARKESTSNHHVHAPPRPHVTVVDGPGQRAVVDQLQLRPKPNERALCRLETCNDRAHRAQRHRYDFGISRELTESSSLELIRTDETGASGEHRVRLNLGLDGKRSDDKPARQEDSEFG